MNAKKFLCTYAADKGSLVVNGVCIDNGVGDGEFNVYYAESLPDGFSPLGEFWFDLRDADIDIWAHDCNCGTDVHTFTAEDLADAVIFSKDENGNFCLIKYF